MNISISDSQSNSPTEMEKEALTSLNSQSHIYDNLKFIREGFHHLNVASIEQLLQMKNLEKKLTQEFDNKKIPLKKTVLIATVFLQTLITGLDIHYYGFNLHRIFEWFILFLPCIVFSMYSVFTFDGLTHLVKLAFNREYRKDYRHLKQTKKSIKNHHKTVIQILHNEPYQFMCFQAIDCVIEQLNTHNLEFTQKLRLEEKREQIKQGMLEKRYAHTLGLIEEFSSIVDKLPYHYRQWKQNLKLQPDYLYENRYQKWKADNEHRHYPYKNEDMKKNKSEFDIDMDMEEEHSAHWFHEFFKKIL
jgi:hypothetical protein